MSSQHKTFAVYDKNHKGFTKKEKKKNSKPFLLLKSNV